jgi:acyl transferase domain-containing protein/NADPH:quinone reductase-like Zn-dependent oxidoreductase
MGCELMTYYPSFLRSVRILDRALEDLTDGPHWTLEDLLLEEAATSRVNNAEFSQPLCTAIQVAIVQLLATWGIKPLVTVGHSSGEIGAAYAAGLISATEAIVTAYYRGKVVRDINTNGGMMAVGLGAEAVAPYLVDEEGKVVVACHNSPAGVTLSGDLPALEIVKERLDKDNVFARFVKTGGKAYHSHHMAPVAERYESLLEAAKAAAPFDAAQPSDAIMISSVTNSIVTKDTIIDAKYWSANLRSPVLFNQAVQTIATDTQVPKIDLLIEIGPHSALSGPIRQICTANNFDKLAYLPTLLRGEDSAAQLLKLAGELFLRDYPLDMERITLVEAPLPSGKIHLEVGRLIVDLPTYQWNYGKDLWSEVRHSQEHRQLTHARHDILGALIPGASLREPSWKNMLRIRDLPWLKDHSLGGEAVFPAAGYFSMAIEAMTQINELSADPIKVDGYVLRDISIKTALVTPDDDTGIEVIYNMRPAINNDNNSIGGWWDFNVSSVNEEGNRKDHIAGSICLNARTRGPAPKKVPNLPQRASGKSWNQALRNVGFDYGPTFQDMNDLRSDGKNYHTACKTAIKTECGEMEGESRYILHPACVDSCLQLLIVSIYAGRLNDMTCGAVPIQVDEVAIWTPSAKQLEASSADAFSWIDQRGVRSFVGGSQLLASDGELLMEISDMRCTLYEAAVPMRLEAEMEAQPYGEMVWKLDIDQLKSSNTLPGMDVAQLIELAIYKNPALRILEIGSSYASEVLKKFRNTDYTITGATDEELEELDSILHGHKAAKKVKFDPVAELEPQGLSEKFFDLIISTEMIGETLLQNIHQLLVQGGRAILESPETVKDTSLTGKGYSGIDCRVASVSGRGAVLTTALEIDAPEATSNAKNEVALVYRQNPAEILLVIEKAFRAAGFKTTVTSLLNLEASAFKQVIMVADFEGPLLATLQEAELSAIQEVCSTVSSILWVTPGGLLAGKKPEYAMAAGLARSITSEQASLNLVTLDFDLDNTSHKQVGELVVSTAQRQVDSQGIKESEYYVSEGLVYVSRLAPNDAINDVYAFHKDSAEPVAFEKGMRLDCKVQSSQVIFQRDESDEPLDANAVEVRVAISGLVKEDVLVINGSDYPTTFSHQVGGVVERLGSNVTELAVGDEVAGFSFNRFATHQKVDAKLVRKVAQGESLQDLVSLPMAFGSALYGIQELAKIQPKENVLVLSGTGHAGLAAIQITQLLGGKPFVVASSEIEADRLQSEFKLTDSQILRPTTISIASQFTQAAGVSGADVVFSSGSVDSAIAQECWRNIAPFGRFIDSGRKNVLKRSVLDTVPLHRGANYMSYDILDIYAFKPQLLGKLLELTFSLYRQRYIKPIGPISTKPIAELNDTVATFSDDFTSGTSLITYEASETSLDVLRSRPSLRFHADATYLLVGCLGGLGRSLTSWMIKKGARRFAFLSRSGTDGEQASILVRDIEAAGVAVQVLRGDVTVSSDVERAIASISTEYPLRGVVHAAMVLKVK